MEKNGVSDFANIILPLEMVKYESDKSIGLAYFVKNEYDEWDEALLFVSKKFVKRKSNYEVRVGIVKAYTYSTKTKAGKPIHIRGEKLIYFLLNEREKLWKKTK